MKKIRLLTLLVLGLAVGTAYAQTKVSGVVKSSEDGQPLAGVTVQVKGTTIGVATGADGSYTIPNAPSNATLTFSYAGMRKQEVPAAGKATVNATMEPDVLSASGVVVTALGGKKQERKLGYAQTTIQGDALVRANTIDPVSALQGKVAGLNIQTSGSAGLTGSPVITLRGAKSLTKNNSPIFVVDGIVMENEEAMSYGAAQILGGNGGPTEGNSATRYGNQMKNLNMADFESVTVLKGAAATSLYGSRGANGAIIFTSKQGKARQGIGVDVSYSHSFEQTYAPPLPLQNVYGMGVVTSRYEGNIVPGTNPVTTTAGDAYTPASWGPIMDGSTSIAQYYKLGTPSWVDPQYWNNPVEPLVAHPDNWKALFNTGHSDNVNVSLYGGSDKATYRFSYNYLNSNGSLPNNEFNRHSVRFSTDGRLNDIFSVNFQFTYSNSNTLNAYLQAAWSGNRFTELVGKQISRNTDVEWYKNNYRDPITYETMEAPGGQLLALRNTLLNYENNNETRNEQTILAAIQFRADLTEWLDADVSVSYNDFKRYTEVKNYGREKFREGVDGKYAVSGATSSTYDARVSLHSNNRFVDDNLELDVRAFYEITGDGVGSNWNKSTNNGLVVPGLWTFGNTVAPLTVNDMGVNRLNRKEMTSGIAAVASLSWKDQITLEVTGRNDWLSTLLYPTWIPDGANNYSVFYPSVNVAWIFTDTFQLNPDIISYGKLRASLAQVGSGPDPYETAGGAGGFTVNATGAYNPAGQQQFTAQANDTRLQNLDLKPEIQQSLELGFDARFLNGLVGIDFAWYKMNTRNQVLSLPAPDVSGVSTRLINAGNIQNTGWEAQLDFHPFQSREVRWDFSFNFARNKGKIKSLVDGTTQFIFSNGNDYGTPRIVGFVDGLGGYGDIVSSGGDYAASAAKWNEQYANYLNVTNGWAQGNANYVTINPGDKNYGKRLIYMNYLTSPAGATPDANWANQQRIYYRTASGNFYWSEQKDAEGNVTREGKTYDKLGNVQPWFTAGFNSTVSYKGFDLFVQVDGRYGGQMISPLIRDAVQAGTAKASLLYRDADNGGMQRMNYKNELVSDGYIVDGVFEKERSGSIRDDQTGSNSKMVSLKTGQMVDLAGMSMMEAYQEGHLQPVKTALYYNDNFTMSNIMELCVYDATYFALREVTVGYNFPEKWTKYVGMQSARLSVSGRNLCYLYNGLGAKSNPESISNNNSMTPIDYGGVPFVRNFSVSLNVRF